ncbi:glycosyltransferase family 2 protein [Massilia antarctica]|uniref:glycosyltransferase family 2 protein n=1 Tax=Massilia antarctica TaxID=2765360 RepID=UPI0006BB8764|nr:glycosyltransferase [Massilia sp. H27-R4]MCY0915230.1 glycosyltransferase [Massilia sp. H27-R4]CUI05715.1 hypothetical protein BN2497_6207 [Janthinobacterium sp. CG23_2]CUU29501.1 hypothetical protein BN3177_6207 [Janthinobacterium sp. CG23_2]
MHIKKIWVATAAVAIIIHHRWDIAEQVYRRVARAGLPNLAIYLIATDPHAIPEASAAWSGCTLLIPPACLDIGNARRFALEHAKEDFIAYLDEDCIPLDSWFDAIAHLLTDERQHHDVVFGPRIETHSRASIGGMIRRGESLGSRKLMAYMARSSHQGAPLEYELSGCIAGGNFIVRRTVALELGVFSDLFLRYTFEDVDFQLRAQQAGKSVLFMPTLAVIHDHPISMLGLARKSLAAGKGLFLCSKVHGSRFSAICRWRVWGPAFKWLALLGLVLASVTASGWTLLPLFLVTWLFLAWKVGAECALPWMVGKPVRDLAMWLGWISAYVRLEWMAIEPTGKET